MWNAMWVELEDGGEKHFEIVKSFESGSSVEAVTEFGFETNFEDLNSNVTANARHLIRFNFKIRQAILNNNSPTTVSCLYTFWAP